MTDNLNISFDSAVEVMGLPMISARTGNKSIYFMLDTGSNNNLIRTDLMYLYGENIKTLEGDGTIYGMDKVVHRTHLYEFTFDIQNQKFTERFLNLPNAEVLDFCLDEKQNIRIHGILGTPFLLKHHLVMDFSDCTISSKSECSAPGKND